MADVANFGPLSRLPCPLDWLQRIRRRLGVGLIMITALNSVLRVLVRLSQYQPAPATVKEKTESERAACGECGDARSATSQKISLRIICLGSPRRCCAVHAHG